MQGRKIKEGKERKGK